MKGRIEKGHKVFQRWGLRAGRGSPGRRPVRVYAIKSSFKMTATAVVWKKKGGRIVLESLVIALNVICMGWRFRGRRTEQ